MTRRSSSRLFAFEGKIPSIAPEAFIAPTACLVGAVTVKAHASIWYNCAAANVQRC